MIDKADKIEIFISYARADEKYLDPLTKALHGRLGSLIRKNTVSLWDDRQIVAGVVAAREILQHLQSARIVLLLITADFMASQFVYSYEMDDLMKRHQAGELRVIPILLREVYWQEAPFGDLAPLPATGDFVSSAGNKDSVFSKIAEGVRKVVDELLGSSQTGTNVLKENKSVTNSTFAHGYALLIGVGGNLPVTVKDATALYDLLINPARAGYPTAQVTLLTEAMADRRRILTEFDHLIEQVNRDPEATVIVYFSGHGGKFSAPGHSSEYFLVPHGYDPNQRASTALSDQEFTAKIEALEARKLVVLLDCCHAGGVSLVKESDALFEKSPVPPSLLNGLQAGSGRVVVASSNESEVSYTGTPYSVFTACLMEALEGKASGKKDGYARILDVLAYLFDHVPSRTSDRQHPFVNKILNLNDNFSLCYYAGGSKDTPGEGASSSPTLPISTKLTTWQRQRLAEELEEQKALRALQNEKVKLLRQASILDTEVLVKFKNDQHLLREEAMLRQIDNKIDEINQQLQ